VSEPTLITLLGKFALRKLSSTLKIVSRTFYSLDYASIAFRVDARKLGGKLAEEMPRRKQAENVGKKSPV